MTFPVLIVFVMLNPLNCKVAGLGHNVMSIKLCCQVRCFYASVCELENVNMSVHLPDK